MKSVVFVSVLLAVSTTVLAAPAPEPQPYGGDSPDSAATTATSAESVTSSQVTRGDDSRDGVRDKKSAPCDDAFKSTASSSSSSTASQASATSQDLNLQERTKGTKLVPIQVPVTKTKFVKVPVQQHDSYSHGHYAYGGHRADEWSQQNFGPTDQERFAYVNNPNFADFQTFQRASQQQMAAAMQAEMTARAAAEARIEELRLATERQAEITARQQALASEQQLAAATMQAEMAAMARAQAQAAELAQQEQMQQAQESRRIELALEKQAIDSAAQQSQVSQDASARSAYAATYSPLSVPLGGYSRGGAAVGYFPRTPISNNCGGIPLLFGCSPTLVRGNLVGGHGYGSGGGGGGGTYSASGYGYGSGYQLGPLISSGLGYGGDYRQAGNGEDSSFSNNGKLVIDLDKMNLQQRELLQKFMEQAQGQINTLSN